MGCGGGVGWECIHKILLQDSHALLLTASLDDREFKIIESNSQITHDDMTNPLMTIDQCMEIPLHLNKIRFD